MKGHTALHSGARGDIARATFATCPVFECKPALNPFVSDALFHYQRWKQFGATALPPSEALYDAVSVLDNEFSVLADYMANRDAPKA